MVALWGLAAVLLSTLYQKKEISQINDDIRKAARERQEQRTKEKSATDGLWFGALANAMIALNPLNIAIPELILGIATTIFYVSSIIINFLWRVFAIILFVFGPIVMAIGSIPGYGGRIVLGYFGAIIQLSAWQIWFAICAWFVRVGNDVFAYDIRTPSAFQNSGFNHFESIAIALVFAVLYLGTPFLINALLPISRFSSLATGGLLEAGGAVGSVGTTAVNTVITALTGLAKAKRR